MTGLRPGLTRVLLLDEAGIANTRTTARIVVHAERAGAKIIAVGDPGQLASVQAGGWLAAVTRQAPGPHLRQVIRQRDPDERRALEALHDGNPDRYLDRKDQGITIYADEGDAIAAVVTEWAGRRAKDARDNATPELLHSPPGVPAAKRSGGTTAAKRWQELPAG